MNKTVAWIIFAIVVLVVLALLAVLPARRANEEEALPGTATDSTIELVTPPPELVSTPSPTPEALTPEQENLADLEAAESQDVNFDESIDADFRGLEGEVKGL